MTPVNEVDVSWDGVPFEGLDVRHSFGAVVPESVVPESEEVAA